MIWRPSRSTPTDTLFPYAWLLRSAIALRPATLRADREHAAVGDRGHGGDRIIGGRVEQEPGHRGQAIQRGLQRLRRVDRRDPGTATLAAGRNHDAAPVRSEEHTSELQSLMRHSYAVFCLKKK